MTLVTRISRLETKQDEAQSVQRFEIFAADEDDARQKYEDIVLWGKGRGTGNERRPGPYVVSVTTPNDQWEWTGTFRTHEEWLEILDQHQTQKDVADA